MARISQNRWLLSALTSAMALVLSTAAQAEGKTDRAQEAIAAASAKIQAAETTGASTATPDQLARAREVLADAREELKSRHKDQAIFDANHAAALADASIGETQRFKAESANNAVANAQSDAAAAHQQAAEATEQAQSDAALARQQAAEANARAANAEQSAAISAQRAETAQAEAAETAATGAGVSTTVTTEDEDQATVAPAHPRVVTKHVVRKKRHGATQTRTTTTVVRTPAD